MLVGRGSMYSVYCPVLMSRRDTRSVGIEPVHASPLRPATASYGALEGVGAQVRKERAAHPLDWRKTEGNLPWQNVIVFRKR